MKSRLGRSTRLSILIQAGESCSSGDPFGFFPFCSVAGVVPCSPELRDVGLYDQKVCPVGF